MSQIFFRFSRKPQSLTKEIIAIPYIDIARGHLGLYVPQIIVNDKITSDEIFVVTF